MARLLFASLVTFGIWSGMVIGCVLAAMLFMGEVNLMLAIVLTVVINLLIWLSARGCGLHASLAQRHGIPGGFGGQAASSRRG